MSTATERIAEWAVPCLDPDPGPLARFAAVTAAANTPSVVFQRLTEGETLKDIAKAWEIPAGRFSEWFMGEHGELYDRALQVRADELAHETLPIADGVPEDKQAIAKANLQVKTRLELASHWDRGRYGNAKEQGAGGITVMLDPSCGGAVTLEAVGHRLKIEKRSTEASEKTIQGEEIGDHRSGPAD